MNKGEYKFTKPQTEESFWPDETIHYELDSKDFTVALDEPIYLMENEEQKPLSEVEKAQPIDDETLLQDKLAFWIKREYELNISHNEAVSKVKYYKSAIKAYEKAFKKLQEIEK